MQRQPEDRCAPAYRVFSRDAACRPSRFGRAVPQHHGSRREVQEDRLPARRRSVFFLKVGSQVVPAILFMSDVDRNDVRKLRSQFSNFFGYQSGVYPFLGRKITERVAKLWITHFFGMLTVAHTLLLFSNIAMLQHLHYGLARFVSGANSFAHQFDRFIRSVILILLSEG